MNSTFYRPPSPATTRGWAARTPEGFRFTAGAGPSGKVWQKFTHPKMFGEPKFRTSIGDVPVTTRRLGYFRFHGRNAARWWHHEAAEDRYNYLYSAAEQRGLADEVREVAQRTEETYAFCNNHCQAKAVVNARQLEMSLGQPASAPLPETLLGELAPTRAAALG